MPTKTKFGAGHASRRTQVYKAWSDMRQRCNNQKHPHYHDYGGRDINVCPRWDSFANFLLDMGEPAPGQTLERKNNSEGYGPDNCVWVSRKEQQRNRRSCQWLAFRGEQVLVTDLAQRFGITAQALRVRIFRCGWDIERAVSTPVRAYGR